MKKIFGILFVAGLSASILSFNQNNISDFEGTNAPDLEASYVFWDGSKLDSKTGKDKNHTGKVGIKDAKIKLNKSKLEALSVTVDLNDMINLDLPQDMQGRLVSHLKSADFFDVISFPDATFTATKITKLSNDKYAFNIVGNITVKGVTKVIQVKGHIVSDKGKKLLETDVFYLNGVDFGFIKPDGGYNDVILKLQLYID